MLLTQKQYAERRGWSKQYVHQLVKQGRLPLTNGMIDPAAADAALARDRDPAKAPEWRAAAPTMTSALPVSDPGAERLQGSFARARTLREHYQAMTAKLEYEAAIGRLIDKAEVEQAAFEAGRRYRTAVLTAAREVGAEIARRYELPAKDLVDLVQEEMKAALLRLAEDLAGDRYGFGGGLDGGEAVGDTVGDQVNS